LIDDFLLPTQFQGEKMIRSEKTFLFHWTSLSSKLPGSQSRKNFNPPKKSQRLHIKWTQSLKRKNEKRKEKKRKGKERTKKTPTHTYTKT
jgi:hypothetical protein